MKAKTATTKKKNSLTVYALIYIVSIVIFGAKSLFQAQQISHAYKTGVYVQENITIHQFESIDCEIIDDLTFKGKGDNARLIYNGDIDSLYIDCNFSYGLKEFRAYYNTTGDYDFSQDMSIIPKQYKQYLVFDFPQGTKQVKMYYQNSTMLLNEIKVNCRDHTNKLNITMSDVFMLAVTPTIIYLVIDYIFLFYISIGKILKK